ncbi:glycoside hydrolase family 28 protein [Pedobacter mucosus]|uniref:glycoside hydrolase family 28 protein n=1 Tax=Pedobacter mucosus TaxID=2895286 RepID=UPI001EE44C45|nr:glycoside hydrolase family 28 protein [Pedobacter mucosus]UKT62975.1 glycoside hydrolase family 28 protein [Pedobacter mucosus]
MKIKIFTILILATSSVVFAQTTKPKAYSWNNLPQIIKPVFRKDTINIVTYKALGDGISLNTEFINKAISDCSAKGGGVVLIPSGMWLTGPIYLKSKVNLHLERGATLVFTADKSQYKIVEGDYEGKSAARNESPINGKDLENIAITGKGIIDANGDAWRAVNQAQLTPEQWKDKLASGGVLGDNQKSWYPSLQFKNAQKEGKSMLIVPGKSLDSFSDMKDFLRPNLLVLKNCKKVLIEGVIFQNSAAWCLHPILCEDLTISGVTVKNPHYAQNGDGMDIESCLRFMVENCILDVGDDAICIKSGKDEEGRKRGVPTAEGIIRGNTIYSGHGGVVVGSEMSGGARDIFIENCTFIGTDKGLRFKSTRGRGGVVERIYARNIFMKDIIDEAIFFDLFYFVKFATDGKRDVSSQLNEGTPIFRNMVFENIVCTNAKKAFFIRGLSEMNIQDITLKNSKFTADLGVEFTDASNIKIDNVSFNTKSAAPIFALTNSKSIEINKVNYTRNVPVLISLDGEQNTKISIKNTDLKLAAKVLDLKNGAVKNAVTF